MTPNEKAATFIGWKPELEDPQPSYPNLKLYHPYRGYKPAPDMSRPDNYIRALEVIEANPALYGDWHFGLEANGYFVTWGDIEDKCATTIDRVGKTWGEAVVQVLAALYDKEHADGVAA